ncbi:MAG: ribosome recycling factor [Tissierellia bacterium]|nr:ribosome recycling factor [Tissierellia bacterium]
MKQLYKELDTSIAKALDFLKDELSSVRAGRAHPGILDRIMVNYYGTDTPLNQMASVSAPEARLILISPYDKTTIPSIEKAILNSDLSLNPSNDGKVIRLNLPLLTEENRLKLTKLVKKLGEESKVTIRNERRNVIETIKKMEKDGDVREDDSIKAQEEVQKSIDKAVADIDKLVENKTQEIMAV